MRSILEKLGWPPNREQAIWTVIMIAVVLSVTVGVTNGLLAGITLFLGFSGVLSLTLYFVPARPRVVASLRGSENAINSNGEIGLIIGADHLIRPLDIDRIVEDEEREARKTMPRAPTPQVPKGSFSGVFDLRDSYKDLLEAATGVSDEELRAFSKKVQEFGQEMRDWLEGLEVARAERLRPFVATARVSEQGQAPADFTWLHLRFPQEFEETEAPPEVPEPPERPKYVSRLGRFALPVSAMRVKGLRSGALRDLLTQTRGANAANYASEDGAIVVSFQVGHINQHVHRDTPPFSLRAAKPGIYEVNWQISADGLSPPAEGKIKIEVRAPETGEPITTLAAALAEREHYSLD